MGMDDLLEKVKAVGAEDLEEFVRYNIRYLSESRQKLFYSVAGIEGSGYREREEY